MFVVGAQGCCLGDLLSEVCLMFLMCVAACRKSDLGVWMFVRNGYDWWARVVFGVCCVTIVYSFLVMTAFFL